MTKTILIIDDEIRLTRSLSFTLRQIGYECLESHNGRQGYELALKKRPDVVLLDVRMPGMSGLEILRHLRMDMPELPVIMMSALDATRDAVEAVKQGAIEYLAKPFDMDELVQLLANTVQASGARSETQFRSEASLHDVSLLGNSPEIRHLRGLLDRAARTRLSAVYLLGELGVGRAVVARDLHQRSCGEDAPFVEVNCATLTGDFVETELFGRQGELPRPGLIEAADGGTLFLHEVEALPATAQARLLDFLDKGCLYLTPGTSGVASNVRLITTSSRDLSQCCDEGSFRRDLYLKLSMLPIKVPPLRERPQDIELLCIHFARECAIRLDQRSVQFSRAFHDGLKGYGWPGNVRELKNLIERLTILKGGEVLAETDLPADMTVRDAHAAFGIEETMRNVERDLVRDALTKAQGRKGLAAEQLGISRHALKRKMQRLGMV
ncbi:Nitrogen regulation protein NR(I) [Pelagimonas phthalicica]|uniref:Nitrogen regulation protein NR(I) n=1 Tax=Pelagimonas phthalicica TaxID=1037362 RepID=A0A238J9E8_9RHOB|nr:sigma-54 dependent transcriptional regulator [Pelagimonas phthalicica]TDS94264.1 DNA-binding NtrC family response regulator [Pelagimonas phthalicica]SMX27209.1 Nitrogen regulation protein NR(I) [Pelagimonas phthalicica]